MWGPTCRKCGPNLTCTCGAPKWLIDAYTKVLTVGDYTQPETTAEIAQASQYRHRGMAKHGDSWVPIEQNLPRTPHDDGPNPDEMEIDWLAINKEFS